MLCARVMRGMASMLMAVTPRSASFCASSGRARVPSVPMRTVPVRSISTSSSEGRPTRRTMSAWLYSEAASGTIRGTGLAVGLVEVGRGLAGTGLDENLEALADELAGDLGREGDARLAFGGLARDGDLHAAELSFGGHSRREPPQLLATRARGGSESKCSRTDADRASVPGSRRHLDRIG